jgi:hypothetical protein
MFQGSKSRWKKRRKSGGLDDEALLEAIRYEFGIWGGLYGAYTVQGGADPKFWYGMGWWNKERPLRGKALIDRVRRAMQIPWPPPPGQLSLF